MSSFAPVKGDLDGNLAKLRILVMRYGTAEDRDLMEALVPDTGIEAVVAYLGLRRAPAAKRNHHAFEGGLVFHYLEMFQIWEGWRQADPRLGSLSTERILKGIFYHDLHKAYRTFVVNQHNPWEAYYGKDETELQLTHATKTLWILQAHGVKLDLDQYHALLGSEGGWSEFRDIKYHSVLSKTLYLLDEMSGNVLGRM